MNIIGPEELRRLPFLAGENVDAPDPPFSEEIQRRYANTHILIFTPRIPWITLTGLREKFGTDPVREPCMYNQDWYLKEDFANTPPDGKWHLLRKEVLEELRAKRPEDIESSFTEEIFPSAISTALTFFAWHALTGEVLWKHDFLWCSDRDHNGDRIYVGRYEDPTCVNKNGFNVHRHLSLRPAYSAAPEIIS